MAIAEISVVPVGTATTSLSRYVADAVKLVKDSGLHFELTGMGTVIEGPLAEVLAVVQKMHETPFQNGASRVYTVIKIDDRRDSTTGIAYKVASVKEKL